MTTDTHTAGPLRVSSGTGHSALLDSSGNVVAIIHPYVQGYPATHEANARRLVACWNAAEGIGTEQLESPVAKGPGCSLIGAALTLAWRLRDQLAAMTAERDQLQDECRRLALALDQATKARDHAINLANDRFQQMAADRKEALQWRDEVERLCNLINTPATADWHEAVRLEAAHQVERWGHEHDAKKDPIDWVFTMGHLASKAGTALVRGERGNGLHGIIAASAALLNWHRHVTGAAQAPAPAPSYQNECLPSCTWVDVPGGGQRCSKCGDTIPF